MSDLISREEAIMKIQLIEKELLNDKKDAINSDDEQMIFAIDNQLNALWRARSKVAGVKTAYNVDKVVERLEFESYEHFDTPSYSDNRQIDLVDAIKIVNEG